MKRHFIVFLIFLFFGGFLNSNEVVPRVVIVMYNQLQMRDIYFLNVHQFAEMPLNHLGINLRYHDIARGFPNIENDPEILGILSWFDNNQSVPNPLEYIEWLEKSVNAGKKFVMMGDLGFSPQRYGLDEIEVNRLWNLMGLSSNLETVHDTYRVTIEVLDKNLMNFERTYSGFKNLYEVVLATDPHVQVLAYARYRGNPNRDAIIAALSPNGGYVMDLYACFNTVEGPFIQGIRGWYIQPFEFFRRAFNYQGNPVPDTTTLAGRRIYYSHVDGDGWNNLTQLEKYRQTKTLCAEVMYQDVFTRYPDLPVTVGPIGADINVQWVGTELSREIGRKIFKLPHVEVGCHTFTHPFDWLFFKHYKAQKEVPYLTLYPHGSWKYKGILGFAITTFQGLRQKNNLGGDVTANYAAAEEGKVWKPGELAFGYTVPRAYALEPFNANKEVIGAIEEVNTLVESPKKVNIMQWSGNCLVFEKIVKLSREAAVRNINGGDSRFDHEAFSYAWVKSIGRQVEQQQQIYSSCSNENIYTDGWTTRFWGQVFVQETFKNTETPIRVKPMNLYYHIFSAEKLSSLSALLQNLEYIKKQSIVPIAASHFAAIGDAFYSTKFIQVSPQKWQILDRGQLQTIRFDHSSFKGVNFLESEGVIGQRHLQGSLYVYLDATVKNPIIALKELENNFEEPLEQQAYLVESRWALWNVSLNDKKIKMKTSGFGEGEMTWRMPQDGKYKIQVSHSQKVVGEEIVLAKNGYLKLRTNKQALDPVEIIIEPMNEHP